jgi:hypothetical protein
MPLPALRDDPNLPADGDVHLSIVMPPETIAASFEGAQDVIDLGAGKSHLQHVTGATGGNAQGLAIDLYGEVCGPVGVRAFGAAWTDDGRAVHLVQTSLPAADPPRLTAAGLDPNAFMKSIEKVPIPIPIAPDQLKSTIPELAKSESDQTVDVSVQIADAHPESAGLRGAGDVIAIVELKGSATIRAK